MLTKVRKWGTSLGLRIPSAFAAEVGVQDGSAVDLTIHDGEIRMRPSSRRRYSTEALVEAIRESNLHKEAAPGRPIGRETW